MSILIFLVGPIAWALTGVLLGTAVAASCFYNERGRRLGREVSRWSWPTLPLAYLAVVITGLGGNAGSGRALFGSEVLADLLAAATFYTLPVLAAFAGAIYVVRDLTLGHTPALRQSK